MMMMTMMMYRRSKTDDNVLLLHIMILNRLTELKLTERVYFLQANFTLTVT